MKAKQELSKKIVEILINQYEYGFTVIHDYGLSIGIFKGNKSIIHFSGHDPVSKWEKQFEKLKKIINKDATK